MDNLCSLFQRGHHPASQHHDLPPTTAPVTAVAVLPPSMPDDLAATGGKVTSYCLIYHSMAKGTINTTSAVFLAPGGAGIRGNKFSIVEIYPPRSITPTGCSN